MDDSLDFLLEATDYLEQYIPIDDIDVILEATPFAKKANENNQNAGNGALNALKKAFDSLITIVRKAITAVTNFIQEAFMSKEDRTKFAYFKKLAANDKKFANRPIRVSDYRAYEKAYDGHMSELDRLYKKGAKVEELNQVMYRLDKTINDLKNRAGDAGKAAFATIGMKAALDLSDRNVLCAKGCKKALEQEEGILANLQRLVGDKNAAKFKKDVDRYSRDGFFHRLKVRILQRKQNDVVECGRGLSSRIMAFFNKEGKVTKGTIVKGVLKNKDAINAAAGSFNGTPGKKGSLFGAVKGGVKAVDSLDKGRSMLDAARGLVGHRK